MNLRGIDAAEEDKEAGTPEDMAILYSWANLHEAKYRDFSASRREYRAQMRRRAAEQQREAELKAKAEAAVAAAEATARDVEEAARLAEAATLAGADALCAEREMVETYISAISAQPQATRYAESETRRRVLAGPQSITQIPDASMSRPLVSIPEDLLERMGSIRLPEAPSQQMPSVRRRVMWPAAPAAQKLPGPAWLYVQQEQDDEKRALQGKSGLHDFRLRQEMSRSMQKVASASPVADTLQHSRERMTAQWSVLKGIFQHPGQDAQQQAQPEAPPARQKELQAPMLAVFSLAGGVGKTSLVATLGRALSSFGEKVLLTDTTSHSLLPYYFGASEQRPDVVRMFLPPSGSTDAPIHLLNYDLDQKGGNQETQDWLAEELTRNSHGMQRILLDLTGSSGWVARIIARMNAIVLIPVAPDMNSVISLQAVEKFFAGVTDADGRQVQPCYLLNQFDVGQPLHLDIREVLGQQLGERLLPFVIRRAPSVSEALAEGMTVIDYAPDAAVSDDYRNIASWLRAISVPTTDGLPPAPE